MITWIMVFCIGLNLGLSVWLVLEIRNNRRKLDERIDEWDEKEDNLQSELDGYRHRLADAMSEVAHLRNMLNKAKAERKDGSDKRPIKKYNVKSNGGSARKSEKRRTNGDAYVCDSLH